MRLHHLITSRSTAIAITAIGDDHPFKHEGEQTMHVFQRAKASMPLLYKTRASKLLLVFACLLLCSTVLSLFLNAGTAQAASLGAKSANIPATSGGGCYTWDGPFPSSDRVCASEDRSHEIVTDAYESTGAPGDFAYFTIEVDLLDATTGNWTYAIKHEIRYPHGHWSGPTIPAVAGHHYIAYTTLYATYTNGTRYISEHADYSPTQIA
jgi:hypothetical protein